MLGSCIFEHQDVILYVKVASASISLIFQGQNYASMKINKSAYEFLVK